MKNNIYLTLGFLALFGASFYLTGCLNDANLIPASCYDGIKNQDEVMTDCGGVCVACDPCLNGAWDYTGGQEQWVDCGGDCETPCEPCFNGIQDPGEDGVDCGMICGVMCDDLCNDGLPNGQEDAALTLTPGQYAHNGLLGVPGIDCGGACEDICPTCIDMEMNGDEIGIDCGGEFCPNCPEDVNCVNGILDGDEWITDFGGCCCPIDDDAFYFTWNQNGVPRSAFNAVATIAGNAIQIGGQTLDGRQILLNLTPTIVVTPGDEPFPPGMEIVMPENGDNANIMKWLRYDEDGFANNLPPIEPFELPLYVTYEVGGSGIFTVEGSALVAFPQYIKGTFSATVKQDGFPADQGISLTNGKVFLPLQ